MHGSKNCALDEERKKPPASWTPERMGADSPETHFDKTKFNELNEAAQPPRERREAHSHTRTRELHFQHPELMMRGDEASDIKLNAQQPVTAVERAPTGLRPPLINEEENGQSSGCYLYRWSAESILVRDNLKSTAEVVGKGELVIRVMQGPDGTLNILNVVVKADGGGAAMDIPQEAITQLADGGGECMVSAAARSSHNVVLLGLRIGCTLILCDVVPIEGSQSLDGADESFEGQAVVEDGIGAVPGGKANSPLPTVTPDRRDLSSMDSASSSLHCPNHKIRKRFERTAKSDSGMLAPTPVGFDPVLAKIIHDNSSRSTLVPEEGKVSTSTMTTACDLECAMGGSEAGYRGRVEPGGRRGTKRPEGENASVIPQHDVTPKRLDSSKKAKQKGELRDRGDGHGGSVAQCRVVREQRKEEVDIPDDQWRTPLTVLPPGHRRATGQRRRPRVRGAYQTVVLHLDRVSDSTRDEVRRAGEHGSHTERTLGHVETGRRTNKRPMENMRAGYVNANEIVETSLQSTQPQRQRETSKPERTWLTLRKALHERYRYFEETRAAEEITAEANVGSVSKGSSWGGEVLTPGLRTFPRQQQAFAFADAVSKRLSPENAARYKVLSFETSSAGKRRFIVCDFTRFEELYRYTAQPDHDLLQRAEKVPRPPHAVLGAGGDGRRIKDQSGDLVASGGARTQPAPLVSGSLGPASEKHGRAATYSPLHHVYEIIREGSPCRMYFDLEFARVHNPGLDGGWLVRAWINIVSGKIYQDFGISVGGFDFLDLDSSTPEKFSRHLILHLPRDQLFENNSHVGRFVNKLAADLEPWKPASQPMSSSHSEEHDASAALSGAGDLRERITSQTPCHDGAESNYVPPQFGTVSPPNVVPRTPDDDTGATSGARFLQQIPAVTPDHGSARSTVGDGRDEGSTDDGGQRTSRKVLETAVEGSGALESLWVRDGDGRSVLFADVSVYTRNRCFRLVGSSKYGRPVTLQVAETNRRTLGHMGLKDGQERRPRDVARRILHDSLVVPTGLRRKTREIFLTFGEGGAHSYSRFGKTQHSLGVTPPRQRGLTSGGRAPGDRGEGCQVALDAGWRVASNGFGPSPFPAIDSVLRTLIRQGGVQGNLRQWNYTAYEVAPGDGDGEAGPIQKARKLTHQVADNRWCWKIGRAHKSNHIFLVTDLSRGEVRQHCHDQDCRRSGYRSNPFRLPPDMVPSSDDVEGYELELGLAAAMRESPADWAALS